MVDRQKLWCVRSTLKEMRSIMGPSIRTSIISSSMSGYTVGLPTKLTCMPSMEVCRPTIVLYVRLSLSSIVGQDRSQINSQSSSSEDVTEV